MRILVVEDDRRLAAVIMRGLSESGHVVDVRHDGFTAQEEAEHGRYDAIVLDVMLPARDGLQVARGLRDAGNATPILMVTSRDTPEDVVSGIDSGADDYLRKPFAFAELEARLRSITRRMAPPQREELRVGDLVLDMGTRDVRRGEHIVVLTARETAFLEFFMRNAGRVLTRRMIEDAMRARDREPASNVIDVYVRRLRSKLSPRGEPLLIHTIRGAGYKLAEHTHDA